MKCKFWNLWNQTYRIGSNSIIPSKNENMGNQCEARIISTFLKCDRKVKTGIKYIMHMLQCQVLPLQRCTGCTGCNNDGNLSFEIGIQSNQSRDGSITMQRSTFGDRDTGHGFKPWPYGEKKTMGASFFKKRHIKSLRL
jgi:hypothetical protein